MRELLNKRNKGVIMVEATIYFPIVILMIIALLQLALFNMQEYMMMYEAQRVSSVVSRETVYTGYQELGMGQNNEIDFTALPSSEQVTKYYEAHHEKIGQLYKEVSNVFAAAGIAKPNVSAYAGRFSDAARQSTLIALGSISEPEIKIDTSVFGTGVTVTFVHKIPVPGAFRYLGYKGNTDLRVAAYNYSVNPGEFVRNVDLATDLVDYIADKLGVSKQYGEFKSNVDKVLSKII